jgi:hypothetical protein
MSVLDDLEVGPTQSSDDDANQGFTGEGFRHGPVTPSKVSGLANQDCLHGSSVPGGYGAKREGFRRTFRFHRNPLPSDFAYEASSRSRSSGSRIIPGGTAFPSGYVPAFRTVATSHVHPVPDYSGGTATESHRVPLHSLMSFTLLDVVRPGVPLAGGARRGNRREEDYRCRCARVNAGRREHRGD